MRLILSTFGSLMIAFSFCSYPHISVNSFLKKFDDTKLEMQIFNNEREYPRMFSEVIEVFYVVACIYVKKNWMKEDIRRKVTNKLFFSLHFLLEQDLTVLLNALSFHLG